MSQCTECCMDCQPGEYHPYAACLMFMGCHNSTTVRANLQAAKPEQAESEAGYSYEDLANEQAKTAVGLPEPDFDALVRIRDEAIGELLKKLFNAAVKYAGTSGAGYSPASADAYHAAEEIKTQITSTVTAYSPTQAEIESYATAKTAEAVRELVEVLEEARDDVCECLNQMTVLSGYPSVDRKIARQRELLARIDALLAKHEPSNGKA